MIISLSKKDGDPTLKEKKEIIKNKLITKEKTTEIYNNIMKNFPDAELLNVENKKEKKND